MMKKNKILIVEDEPHIVELVKASLESEGFEVLWAEDGEKGLEKAASERPDLILLDAQMPVLDGYEVCRKIKSSKNTRGIPVVFLTSKAHPMDMEKGRLSGADSYLTKPFSPLKLLAVVKEKLG